MKQGESQGCINTNNYKRARPLAFGWGRRMQRGEAEEIKSQTRAILKTINTFHTIHISNMWGSGIGRARGSVVREWEQLFFLYVAHCINLIHIAIRYMKIFHRVTELASTRAALEIHQRDVTPK